MAEPALKYSHAVGTGLRVLRTAQREVHVAHICGNGVLGVATVGARELKEHTSSVLRRVREGGETIDITYRGQAVARLVPLASPMPSPEQIAAMWAEDDALAAEIAAAWQPGPGAVEAVSEGRREL